MKMKSSTNKFVVVSSTILAVLIIGLFLIPARLGTITAIILISLYFTLIVASLSLLIKTFLSRKKITRKWIKYFAFLPICVALLPPLFLLALEEYKYSILDKQRHELIYELRSSELLENGWHRLNTYRVVSKGSTWRSTILFKPKKEGDSYIYDFDNTIYEERERKLIIKADNCIALFHLDIPEMPKPQPFSKWEVPVKIKTAPGKKIRLKLRYKVIKN